jgi:predicted ABC-type ATPase
MFNSDDRAAQLNAGSYHNIPLHIRAASGQELQQFIDSHIEARRSFAFENALRTDACFQQMRRAKELGFEVRMNYLAAGPVEEHIRRVRNRAALGGHSASERKLRDIYENSMKNLVTAFEHSMLGTIDVFRVFDNSGRQGQPRLVVEIAGGAPRAIAADVPAWLETALAFSPYNLANLKPA